MAIKDFWVYQKRNTPTPWALYIVKEYDKRIGSAATCLDFTLYSEDIDTPTHSTTHVGIHCSNVSGYVKTFIEFMSEHVYINDEDMEQLRQSIENILFH